MHKLLFLFFAGAAFIKTSFAQINNAVKQYVEAYKELAISEMLRTGVPATITLAQGILESNSGQSELTKQSNNHFGIKCKTEWTGDAVYHDDDVKNECFRKYATAEDSYHDHSDFLKSRPYYTSLFNLDPTDYEGWAYGLKKAGYATNPNYARLLIKVINDNNLNQYTLIALERQHNSQEPIYVNNQSTNPPDNTVPVNSFVENDSEAVLQRENAQNQLTAKVAQSVMKAPAYPTGVFAINQTKVIYAKEGMSLFALASNYGVDYKKLLEFNELENTTVLNEGRLIFLEKKPKRSNKDFHVVESSETIELIAQTEGVQLQSLLEYNDMQKGMQPAAGDKIYLNPLVTTFNIFRKHSQ